MQRRFFPWAAVALFRRILSAAQAAAADPPPKRTEADFDKPHEIHTFPATPMGRPLRLASWNIDRGEHLDVISSELRHDPVDLLLLQEVDWNTVRGGRLDEASELARRLQMNGRYAIEFEGLTQGRGQQAVIC